MGRAAASKDHLVPARVGRCMKGNNGRESIQVNGARVLLDHIRACASIGACNAIFVYCLDLGRIGHLAEIIMYSREI